MEDSRDRVKATDASPAETPDTYGAFPRLSEEQVKALEALGRRRRTEPNEVLFRAGDKIDDFIVILDGKVALLEERGGGERVIGVHGPGRFLGELNLMCGQPVFVTAVVREPGELLVVPVERLRDLVAHDADLADLILRAFLIRRHILIRLGAGFRIIGSRYSPDARRLREFAARNRLPHSWVDLEEDPDAETLLRELGIAPEETPVVIWRGTNVLRNPTNAELARVIGLRVPTPPTAVCDLLVVGAGPAGLAAAVYGSSDGLATTALDAVATGGQAATSSRIENYLGFPAGISGSELADRALIQAERFGARISVPAEASALEEDDGYHVVRLEDGEALWARAVLIATGARYRKLAVPRLEEFEGVSVHYAATQIEAELCHSYPVAVVGGGNSAAQATLFLAQHTPLVRLIIRHDDLRRDMSRYLADRIERIPNVEILLNTEVRQLVGNGTLEALVVEDCRTGERLQLEARLLFVFIGAAPHTRWLEGQIALDQRGFILTGIDASPLVGDGAAGDNSHRAALETSRPGVFAAGDVRSGSVKRVASAVGEGAMAVRLVFDHFDLRHGRGDHRRDLERSAQT
jgi:thioredoxin reductase (NADPH)